MCRINFYFLIMTVSLFCAAEVFSLPADSKQKVHIVADTWTYNYKNGTSLFMGNVKVDQGSTHITADKLTTKSNTQHKLEEAIAYGLQNLAHYWTLPKEKDAEIHAQAKVIKYYPITANITLQEAVVVTQGDNSFNGEVVYYNMNDQTITVPATKSGRAVLVYNPDS